MQKPIVLIGLSGTGKSVVGPMVARVLGYRFIDTDALIEEREKTPITNIFAEKGEVEFRLLETQALAEALASNRAVVATGGGIVEQPENQELLRRATVIWLTARPETLAGRLAASKDRPLLAGDPLSALRAQLLRRAQHYSGLADWVVATDSLDPAATAREIVRFVEMVQVPGDGSLVVNTPGGSYEVVVEAGALDQLPQRLSELKVHGHIWIVSDDQVWPIHGQRLLAILHAAGRSAAAFQIPAGEASKQLAVVSHVYDWLIQHNVERRDLLIAVGGGVVGDLAGYVASTVLRGIALVQIPTTVLAMVDSSIGGKTGVDHRAGKNLIGTFYQPRLVLADTTVLKTLPAPERQAGWTEAIKHGVIADAQLFDDLVAHAEQLRSVAEPATSALIRRAAAVKVRVVSGDEREQGPRILLNYGHTIGHALERWSSYRIRHGEAVAAGMQVAAAIARRMGLCDTTLEQRQTKALEAFALPTELPPGIDVEEIIDATRSDKKVSDQRIRWVLPTSIGSATVRNDVPDAVVVDALRELGAA